TSGAKDGRARLAGGILVLRAPGLRQGEDRGGDRAHAPAYLRDPGRRDGTVRARDRPTPRPQGAQRDRRLHAPSDRRGDPRCFRAPAGPDLGSVVTAARAREGRPTAAVAPLTTVPPWRVRWGPLGFAYPVPGEGPATEDRPFRVGRGAAR